MSVVGRALRVVLVLALAAATVVLAVLSTRTHEYRPAGVLAVLTGLAWWVVWKRPGELRRERRAKGLCIHCGYDLRATPGRCPECGEIAT
jgi:hypothetical protein